MTADYRFLPALDRITHEEPPKAALTVSRIVMALVAVLVLWSLLGRLDIVVVAEGRLVPESYVKIVQPAEAGVVRDILVQEGDHVQEGQVLIRMDDTLNAADTTALTRTLALKKLELRRMAAELSGRPFTAQAGDDMALFREAKARYDANRAAWSDSTGSAQEQQERARGDLAAARQELTKLEKLLPVYQAELQAMASLRSKGYVSELDYNAKQRETIDTEQNLAAQRARIAALEAAERQAGRQLSNATTGYRADLERERVVMANEVQQLEQQVAKQQHRNASLELKAPQAGIVKDLATHTPGAVVSPGTVLLSLVPDQEKLQAEVQVRNEDVGRLQPGLPVQVKVHAFRFQRYGMLGGTLEKISPDTAAAENPQGGTAPGAAMPPTYKAIVSVHPAGDGEIDRQTLSAGMTVTVEIDVGTRTPFEYLVDPVSGVLGSAGRE
ncbi:MAG: HlyD family type I secretion periplasmic adaptor subunit [Pseudomonadota bacterium]